MAKLNRVTGKLFGETANSTDDPILGPEIGQFGSAKAGTYVGTGDVATIQNLPAWSNGWIDAVTPTNQYPALPERTGVDKVLSYQECYLLQQGIAEWDSATDYYENNFCSKNGKIYISQTDSNLNNDPESDTVNWKEFVSGGGSRNIGEIVSSTIPLTDAGLHLLDGALISGSGSYSAFVNYIADLYDSGSYSAIFTTEANWQSAVATYGVCNKFVYNSVNNTVRLPKYGNQIITKNSTITTASTVPVKGNGKTLGLTNGTNNAGLCPYNGATLVGCIGKENTSVGTAYNSTHLSYADGTVGIITDGSKSGVIADTSNLLSITNYSLDCYYYIVIATTTKTSIEVDIDEIATDLNGKADVDLSNLSSTQSTNFDGQWVSSMQSVTGSTTEAGSYSYSLSSYLPNDSYNYEVMFHLYSTASSASAATITTDIFTINTTASYAQASFASAGGRQVNDFILPVGANRTVNLTIGETSTFSALYLRVFGYRRIGTNQ